MKRRRHFYRPRLSPVSRLVWLRTGCGLLIEGQLGARTTTLREQITCKRCQAMGLGDEA